VTLELAAAELRQGRIRAIDLVEQSLAAIDRDQPRTNAFIRVDADRARADAVRADGERARGIDRGPLHGLPISLKDLIDVAGEVTTAASHVLDDRVAPADAPVVSRLRDSGAILIGKTNLHQFALGTTSDVSAFGAVHHPRDPSRSAGGSSGGSAAAVACGMGLASIGTDTGGSIRIPAAACGIVGLKPSIGDVPVEGVIPLSLSLDHVGPITTSVADAALLWSVLAARRCRNCRLPIRDSGSFGSAAISTTRSSLPCAMRLTRRSGCLEAPVSRFVTPSCRQPRAFSRPTSTSSCPKAPPGTGAFSTRAASTYAPTIRARFESGRSVPAINYIDGLGFCRALQREVTELLADVDALVLPTLPITAPRLGDDEITVDPARGDRTPVRTAMLKHTQPFNMSGHPAISLPIRAAGLPVGCNWSAD
jgi:aspartyl-tRNA(Asn)/glutamyl-tRNA(Gln) amidotransferase subunit A